MQPFPKTTGNKAELPSLSIPEPTYSPPLMARQDLADLQVTEWNSFAESIGSFADNHSTL
ncbi:MAG: hypothetical protein RIR45_2122 [Pseudomonadota bacterium]|jgi:hypothetical protein